MDKKIILFNSKSILVFIIAIIIVLVIHYPIFQLVSQIDLSHDDWALRTHFKALGPNPYSEFYNYYKLRSAYFAYQTFYIGTLEEIFGFNPPVFNQTNLLLKILATLSVYPLVLILFRRELLAFLVTILFAFNYQPAGTLEFITKGADYIGLLFMNIFLIVYCHIIRGKLITSKWLGSLLVFFLAALLSSPARTFPLLVLPIIVEFFVIIGDHSRKNVRFSFIRLLTLYVLLLLIIIKDPSQYIYIFTHVPGIITRLIEGYWYQILVPFAGLGLTLFPSNFLGSLANTNNINSFQEFLRFILNRPLEIFGVFTLIFALIKTRKPIHFTLLVLFINFFLDVFVYFILTSVTKVNLRSPIDSEYLFIVLLGIYMLVISIAFFLEWQFTDRKDNILLALGVGPSFSLIFISLTWLLADQNLDLRGLHYYLSIPSLGSSLFIAGFLVVLYDKTSQNLKLLKLPVLLLFILLFLIPLYLANYQAMNNYFKNKLLYGRGASANNQMNIQMQSFLDKYEFNIKNPSLFYFDETNESYQNRVFYEQGFTTYFSYWMHLKDTNNLQAGCVGVLPGDGELEKLKKFIKIKDGQIYLEHNGFCFDPKNKFDIVTRSGILYKPENFYAFKLKDRKIIDIREEVFKELDLNMPN